jgi:anti-anti-sigma factor
MEGSAMTARARYFRRHLVVAPREALVAGGPAEDLERTIQAHLASGRRHITIDLAAVPHLDSAGVRALVRGHTSAERLGGRLTIVGANEQIRSLFQVTHLDRVFTIGESGAARFLSPATWALLRLWTGGVVLVGLLLWGGSQWPSPMPRAKLPPEFGAQAPAAVQVIGAVPLLDLGKLLAAASIGLLVTGIQRRLQQDKPLSRAHEHAQVLLCAAGSLMMLIIGDNLARAFGIAGAASIIRFRTPIEDPKQTTTLFILMGLGMMTGLGAFAVAGVSTTFLCLLLVVLDHYGGPKPRAMMVEITAKNREFPAAEVETVFALNRIRFERREVTHGEKTVARYHATLDPRLSIQDISEQLVGDGTAGIKSIVWEPPKKSD